jgi:hypothetical protein
VRVATVAATADGRGHEDRKAHEEHEDELVVFLGDLRDPGDLRVRYRGYAQRT